MPAPSPLLEYSAVLPIAGGDILSKGGMESRPDPPASSAEEGGDCESLFALSGTLMLEEFTEGWFGLELHGYNTV